MDQLAAVGTAVGAVVGQRSFEDSEDECGKKCLIPEGVNCKGNAFSSERRRFFRTRPLLFHKFFSQETYIHFTAQKPRLSETYSFLIFFIKNIEIANAQVVFLLVLL